MNADIYPVHELPPIPEHLTDMLTQTEPREEDWLIHKYTNRPDLLDYYRVILSWYAVPEVIKDWIFSQDFFANHEHLDNLNVYYHRVKPECNGIHTDDLRTFTYNYVIDAGHSSGDMVPVANYDSDRELKSQIWTQSGTWYYLNVAENHRVWNFDQTRHLVTVCDIWSVEKALAKHPGLMI